MVGPPDDPVATLQRVLAAIEARADHFALLGVSRDVAPTPLRDAYFHLARLVHPDLPQFVANPRFHGQATRALQAISAAHATLADPAKRTAYVQTLRTVGTVPPIHAPIVTPRDDAHAVNLPAGARRTSGPQSNVVDVVKPVRHLSGATPLGHPVQAAQVVPAPTSPSRLMVANSFASTGQHARPTPPQTPAAGNPAMSATGQHARPTPAQNPVLGSAAAAQALTTTGQHAQPQPAAMTSTGQHQRPHHVETPVWRTPSGATPMVSTPRDTSPQRTQSAPWRTPTPGQFARVPQSLHGAGPPASAEIAKAYLANGRQYLNRRDFAAAQEALELALPVLESASTVADCKVQLGWAIYNNQANPEPVRLERSKQLWNQVAALNPNTSYHAQAAYYLAVWHRLHGESRLVMSNLITCLDLQPNHVEAMREKRRLEQKREGLGDLKDLEARVPVRKQTRGSGTKPAAPAKPDGAAAVATHWLGKLFGGE